MSPKGYVAKDCAQRGRARGYQSSGEGTETHAARAGRTVHDVAGSELSAYPPAPAPPPP